MSRHYLLEAVRDRLYSALGYDDRTCAVDNDPRPPAVAGHLWVSVYPGGYREQGGGMCLDEYIGINVTITMRVNTPNDRIYVPMLKAETGIEDRAMAIREAIHMNYPLMNACNVAIYAATARLVGGFIEPLRCKGGISEPRLEGAEWFLASKATNVGLVVDIRFDDARRIQSLGSAT